VAHWLGVNEALSSCSGKERESPNGCHQSLSLCSQWKLRYLVPCHKRLLQQIEEQGRSAWRVLSGCTRQSIAENTMFRVKTLFGGRLWAQSLERQHTEARVKCSILNRMTQLGMPEAVRMS
jgi:hypothetical protein